MFESHKVNSDDFSTDGATSVFAIDLDGDGFIDILSASGLDDKIAWYKNDGQQNFTAHVISNHTDYAYCVYAIDLDGDKDIDVLSASDQDHKIAWYENDGQQNFTAHVISNNANGANKVFAIDLDGDEDIDVLSSSWYDDKVAWYENDGSQNFIEHTISTTADGARSVYACDIDGDLDIDVMSTSLHDSTIAWYENNGEEVFTTHILDSTAASAISIKSVDMDGDNDIDIVAASSGDNTIKWFENKGNLIFESHIITTNAKQVSEIVAIDIDNDRDIDVAFASWKDNSISWCENLGDQSFQEHIIDNNVPSAYAIYAIDIDNDDDVDLLSASYAGDKILWHDNLYTMRCNFSANIVSGNVPLNVQFRGFSTSSPNSWQWDFNNDGITDSELQNPNYTYLDLDTFSVKLIVTNGFTSDTLLKEDYIKTFFDPKPNLFSIQDIPQDQGGWVMINFGRSGYDTDSLILKKTLSPELYTIELYDSAGWICVATSVAYGKSVYSVLVPTIKDSTSGSNGLITFRVIAGMNEGNYVSNVLSGYSVDNLVPSVPQNLIGSTTENNYVQLTWLPVIDNDLQYYKVYKSSNGLSFDLIGITVETIYVDKTITNNNSIYYSVKSVDNAGNESDFSNITNINKTGLIPITSIPTQNHLLQNFPNPFNPVTIFKFELSNESKVILTIFDIVGRPIEMLINNTLPAGYYSINWDASSIPSGVYFYHLQAGDFQEVKRCLLIK
ncbi:MAG: FG-GAP-like repeat-containing protein [Bacteroidales bacterium]